MIGDRIYELRKSANLSQEKLGEKINVTRQTVSNWETNQTIPDLKQSKKLAKALNLKSIDELLETIPTVDTNSKIDWHKTLEILKKRIKPKVSSLTYKTWFDILNFVNYDRGTIILSVPSNIHVKHLNDNYKHEILNEIEEIIDYANNIKFVVEK